MSIEAFGIQLKQQQNKTQADNGIHLYAIVDSAQDVRVPAQLNSFAKTPLLARCLLAQGNNAALNNAAPHLVTLPAFEPAAPLWRALHRNAPANPGSITVIASAWAFDALYAHLAAWTEVVMPDGDEMIFAYWDNAIFATLIGQQSDQTLHEPGPVLTAAQAATLMAPIAGLWYWDRTGLMHLADAQIEPQANKGEASKGNTQAPMQLAQVQVDRLVEASVPDSLVVYLQQTQPVLMNKIEPVKHYAFVRAAYVEAKGLGLRRMQDHVRYICIALMYGAQFKSDQRIFDLLAQVKFKSLNLEEAIAQLPAIESTLKANT